MRAEPWTRDWIYWAEAVPGGGVLALVIGGDVECLLNCPEGRALPIHLVHAAQTVRSDRIASPGGVPPGRPVASSTEPYFGEFGGIACQPTRCAAAWMAGSGVDVAWIIPGVATTA